MRFCLKCIRNMHEISRTSNAHRGRRFPCCDLSKSARRVYVSAFLIGQHGKVRSLWEGRCSSYFVHVP